MSDQQAARDAIAAVLENYATVRLPRRSVPHVGTLTITDTVARVRWKGTRRNNWRTLTPRHLAELEVKVGNRYVPFSSLNPSHPQPKDHR